MHSNEVDGGIMKKNFYCGLPDCMQINFSQSPVERLDIAKKLLTIVAKLPPQNKFAKDIVALEADATKKINKLMGNCDNLLISESAVRAEIRVRLERAISFAQVLDSYVDEDFAATNCIVLDMGTLTKLIKFWISLLFQPIINSLSKVLYSYNQLGTSENPLEKYLPTISAFNSLLTSSLFSGNTWSFLPSYLYGKSKVDRVSFELLKSIKERNRIDFSGELWIKDELLIAGDSKLLDELIKKFRIPDMDRVIETFNLLINIRNTKTDKQIAILLWNAYFKVLWQKSPADFHEGIRGNERLKEATLILTEEVKLAKKSLPYDTAVQHVFSVERLEKAKGRNSDVWSFPYLLAYKDLTHGESKIKVKTNLDMALAEVAVELGIEYVHVHGDETHFFQHSSKRTYFTVKAPAPNPLDAMVLKSRAVTPVKVSSPLNTLPLTPVSLPSSSSPSISISKHEIFKRFMEKKQVQPVKPLYSTERTFTPPVKRRAPAIRVLDNVSPLVRTRLFFPTEQQHRMKRQRIPFSDQEKINFFIGLNTFAESTRIFSDIANCRALGFCDPSVAGKIRTNGNLKDLEVTLVKNNEVRVDVESRTVYWSKSNPIECRERPDIIDAPVESNLTTIDPSTIRPSSNSPVNVPEDRELSLIRQNLERRHGFARSASLTAPDSSISNPKRTDASTINLDSAPTSTAITKPTTNFIDLTDVDENTAYVDEKAVYVSEPDSTFGPLYDDDATFMSMASKYLVDELIPAQESDLTDNDMEPIEYYYKQFNEKAAEHSPSLSSQPENPYPQPPPAPVKKAPSKPKVPKEPSSVITNVDPETERINQELTSIINEIYGDTTAGPYFIRILRRIPMSVHDGWKHTWATVASNMLTYKRRQTTYWNALKIRLLSLNLIEEGNGKIVIRKFN